MYNKPKVTTRDFSFGPGVLYLAALTPGVAPIVAASLETEAYDVGSVRAGANLAITRDELVVEQGTPATRVKSYVTKETAVFSITEIEWNLNNLRHALGAGERYGATGVGGSLGFGGDMTREQVQMMYVHKTPASETVKLFMWVAEGSGGVTLTWAADLHEFPASFGLVGGSTPDWEKGGTNELGDRDNLFRITYSVT